MNQVSFQCRPFFPAAIQTIGFHTMKLLGYLNNRGFLTKALYNKIFRRLILELVLQRLKHDRLNSADFNSA